MPIEFSPNTRGRSSSDRAGLTPGRLVAWLRDEGYRAKADLEGESIHILTGLSGYAVNLWCIRTGSMDARCAQVALDVKLDLSSSNRNDALRRVLNEFNLTAVPAAVATVEPTGIVALRMSFLAEEDTTPLLFGRYFAAFEHLLQEFLRRIAAVNRSRAPGSVTPDAGSS